MGEELRVLALRDAGVAAAVGAVVLLIAFDEGGFSISSRATIAIATWWTILLAVALSVWPRERTTRASAVVGGLLTALTIWTLASTAWADSAENAFREFNRVALYVGLFLLAVLGGTRRNVSRLVDGLTLGIVATGAVALLSRLFPDLFSAQGIPTFLPAAQTRLSFPLGYWNGVGIFLGLGYPLCLRSALLARHILVRGGAVAAIPVLSAAIYLTSSRGGVAVAWIATLAFVALTTQRWTALGASVAAAAGSILAIVALAPNHELVDGPVRSGAAADQGRTAFFLIVACCVGVGAAYAVTARALAGRIRAPEVAGRATAGVLVLAVVVGLVASHPLRRFDDFKRNPALAAPVQDDSFVKAHLFSGNGSGRWQFWTAAAKEFESRPVAGGGAGSYEAWWAEHASFSYFVRNAHSLYMEVLGELGVVGFLLLVSAFGYGAWVALQRVVRASGGERDTIAALTATLAAFYVGAGIDWIWQLTLVAGVGVVTLGLLVGPATATARTPRLAVETTSGRLRSTRFVAGVAAVVAAWLVVCAQAIPWLADLKVRASEAAAQQGDGSRALRDALAAKSLQPWAASPYLQLALVSEQLGDLGAARRWIGEAIDRNRDNWRLWLVAARIETKAGRVEAARRNLVRAASLNPRSPLFAGVVGS